MILFVDNYRNVCLSACGDQCVCVYVCGARVDQQQYRCRFVGGVVEGEGDRKGEEVTELQSYTEEALS